MVTIAEAPKQLFPRKRQAFYVLEEMGVSDLSTQICVFRVICVCGKELRLEVFVYCLKI